MTHIKIIKEANSIVTVSCEGHAEAVLEGEFSIVCAGVSTIVQTALLGLLTVANIELKFDRDEEKGKLSFSVPKDISSKKRHDADIILDTMLAGLSDLYQGYSDFIKLEVI